MLVDRDDETIGDRQSVYVDVETDESQFAIVKDGTMPSSDDIRSHGWHPDWLRRSAGPCD